MYRQLKNRRIPLLKTCRITSGIAVVLICMLSGVFAQTGNSPKAVEIDISKWLAESLLKTKQAHFRLVSDYTYKMRRTVTKQNGEISSTLFESYFPPRLKNKGGTGGIIITLEENGVPLPEKKVEKQRREAAAKLEKIADASEQKSMPLEEQREKGLPLDWTFNVAVGLNSFLQHCDFHSPLREILDGRETITLSFNECRADKLPENKAYQANMEGRIQFDELEKIPVRLEAWAKKSASSPKILLLFKQKRITESVWLPELIRVEGVKNEAVFPNLKINWQLEFFDYKLPQTEIKDVKVGSQ